MTIKNCPECGGTHYGSTSCPMPKSKLPRYQSHKKVRALKIAAIEFEQDGSAKFAPSNKDFPAIHTDPGYRERFKAEMHGDDLGYYVVYAGGYESWSPTKAFEEGYTACDD